ncbi:hypothetical protein BROOK1789C_310 [Bathymodiolus brooksi thiotrophic gill symbiont]|nr:hypothetical protein BROOK1789B_1088 [Bathymodiolus brooksi thiotrophic gill symbiont]CAC9606939.1 hypothetical protein [uncultured Gammaproteobacteria bacterium]CAB9542535.1 hypothetical protein BROOK1789C_310 [Bathymodiolus brooksi thiotrophic gill symbiont]CAC9956559.1 hypothetical protein [uncultured Gammaproteobacteria bacterium]CAC9967912.1 hypothetical protein [uncultured Gammaproteobacteria bacterium]
MLLVLLMLIPPRLTLLLSPNFLKEKPIYPLRDSPRYH